MTDTVGFPRWTKDVTFASPGSWSTDYPLANLATLPFARVARSANVQPTNTRFRGAYSQPRLTEIVALCRHNLTLDAQWRVRLFEDAADVAPIFDSGWIEVWPPVFDDPTWDSGTWMDGKYTPEQIAGYPWHTALYIPGGCTVAAFTVEIVDTTNPAGFVQIGLCEVAAALDLPFGYAFGAQLGFDVRTTATEADGGVKYYERKSKRRTFAGSLAAVERGTALASFYEMQRQCDIDTPFFWWPTRENLRDALRTAYLARFKQIDPLTQAYTAHDTLALTFEEVL